MGLKHLFKDIRNRETRSKILRHQKKQWFVCFGV